MSETELGVCDILKVKFGIFSAHPDNNLVYDFDMDSLEVVDFSIEIEKRFKIVELELFPSWLFTKNCVFLTDGKLSEQGKEELAQLYPWLKNIKVGDSGLKILTIKHIAKLIEEKIK